MPESVMCLTHQCVAIKTTTREGFCLLIWDNTPYNCPVLRSALGIAESVRGLRLHTGRMGNSGARCTQHAFPVPLRPCQWPLSDNSQTQIGTNFHFSSRGQSHWTLYTASFMILIKIFVLNVCFLKPPITISIILVFLFLSSVISSWDIMNLYSCNIVYSLRM